MGDENELDQLLKRDKLPLSILFKRDVHSVSVLDWTYRQGHQHLLDQLYADFRKKKIKLVDTSGINAIYDLLYWALVLNQSVDEISYLLEHDEYIATTVIDDLGNMPLHLAVRYNSTEVCALLIDKGASITAQNNSDWSPLSRAIIAKRWDVVTTMLKRQADNSLPKSSFHKYRNTRVYSTSAIEFAAQYGKHRIVKLLLQKRQTVSESELRYIIECCVDNDDLELAKTYFSMARDLESIPRSLVSDNVLHRVVREDKKEFANFFLKSGFYDQPNFEDGTVLWELYQVAMNSSSPAREACILAFIRQPMLKAYIENMEQRILDHGMNHTLTQFGISSQGMLGFDTGTLRYRFLSFGYTAEQKLAAAQALARFADDPDSNNSVLDEHQGALNNGELGRIYGLFRR